jgi:hypothetical protein
MSTLQTGRVSYRAISRFTYSTNVTCPTRQSVSNSPSNGASFLVSGNAEIADMAKSADLFATLLGQCELRDSVAELRAKTFDENVANLGGHRSQEVGLDCAMARLFS